MFVLDDTFQIVTGWWRHQLGQPVVVGVLTSHSLNNGATI
jgi:hypothetical protein